ncbi:hypothetical protein SAMN05660865_01175 [Caloramator fervidus]|uniref:Uncharacterized protein n=1 Tax=Caloramator fervidus TaxID=29344 RepID=A0A1H5VC34_9CLOT|nr:hypothetical protein [Caloramator fervidus]SEF84869.1 hypothetical protein SAMN05660865_01175 [Caloramator fervidus]
MSKKCEKRPDFNSLLALLLIVLQFGKKEGRDHHDGMQLLDDSVLFIVALYLVICGCCGLKRCC